MTADRWKEIERLYEASISLPAEQRAILLSDCRPEQYQLAKRGSLL